MRDLCDVYTEYKRYTRNYGRELPESKREEMVRFLIRLLDEKKAFYVTVDDPEEEEPMYFITDMPKQDIKHIPKMGYVAVMKFIKDKGYCVVEDDFLFEIGFIDETISMRKELPVTIVI